VAGVVQQQFHTDLDSALFASRHISCQFLGLLGQMIAFVDTGVSKSLILCLKDFNFSQSFRHVLSTMGCRGSAQGNAALRIQKAIHPKPTYLGLWKKGQVHESFGITYMIYKCPLSWRAGC
jgi:hypothetical protein